MMRLRNFLLVVDDIERSVRFYREVFGLQVLVDYDGNVIMTEGLVLQDRRIWESFIEQDVAYKGNDAELYFEDNDMDGVLERFENCNWEIEYVNKLITHSWGQRVIRLYDPDHHIIEIGESMEYVEARNRAAEDAGAVEGAGEADEADAVDVPGFETLRAEDDVKTTVSETENRSGVLDWEDYWDDTTDYDDDDEFATENY